MKIIPKFKATKINGKLRISDVPMFNKYIETLPADRQIEVVVKEYKNTRNNQQNSLYWVILTIIGDHLGYTKTEIHDILGAMYLSKEITVKTEYEEKKVTIVRSTTSLKTDEMAEYITKVIKFGEKENNLIIPSSDEIEL